MALVAVGCPTSRKLGLITKKKCVSQASAVPQSNSRNLLESHNPQVGLLAYGSSMGIDLLYVKFATPAFKICAFHRQF
jgi:hypothetical protein